MIQHLPNLQKLVNHLRRIPFLASKNVYRIAMHFLTSDKKWVEQFCAAILEAKATLKPCSTCFNWTQGESVCTICAQTNREKHVVCVVETWHDLLAIERAGAYQGLYHVLGGSLCPLEGIGPENLTINPLISRLESGEITELIFATNPTPEGEATASYISSKIDKNKISVSKLASGVPTGSSLEYMDRVTIYKALSGRRPF